MAEGIRNLVVGNGPPNGGGGDSLESLTFRLLLCAEHLLTCTCHRPSGTLQGDFSIFNVSNHDNISHHHMVATTSSLNVDYQS